MPTSAEYRRSAEESGQQADLTDDTRERVTLLRLARQWEYLADYKAKPEADRVLKK